MFHVYSNENCRQCEATKFLLDKQGIDYTDHKLSENPHVATYAKERGWTTAPVVIVTNDEGTVVDSWSGLQPFKIKSNR